MLYIYLFFYFLANIPYCWMAWLRFQDSSKCKEML